MPKILITGNGFDLNIGLPTSYHDFIKILAFVESNNSLDFQSVYSNSSNYEKILENFKDFSFNPEQIENLKETINKNLWFQFFKNEFEIESWIDFENKIEYVLENLFSSIEYIKTNIFSKGPLSDEKIVYNSRLFNHNVELIQVLNKFNIIHLSPTYDITLNKDLLSKNMAFLLI